MSDDSGTNQKLTGYLEKKGKLKLMNSWKRYWFVLKGNLLLYYGSKEEYDALSPVKGRITLGPSCNVKPYPSTPAKFQITSRSGRVITLRAENTSEQNKWMKAIYSVVNENQKIDISPTKLNHFRYSTERLEALLNNSEQKKRNPSPGPTDTRNATPNHLDREDSNLLERLQKIGARSYCDSMTFNNQQLANRTPIPKKLNVELNEKNSKSDSSTKETGLITPKKLQHSPEVPKIPEKPITKEKIIMEEEDYCVCSLARNEDIEVPQATQTPRSISRFTFNQRKSKSSISSKIIEEDKFLMNQDIQTSPSEKNSDPHQSTQPTIDYSNKNMHPNLTDNNKTHNSTDIRSEEDTGHDKKEETKCTEIVRVDQMSQQSNQNKSAISPGYQIDGHQSKKNNHEAISGNEREKTIKNSSYQDFREDELYAKKHEKIEQSSEESYTEPTVFQTPKDKLEFQFPPPPSEAYESTMDLTSNPKYEDDEDSLYEEAEDVADEDFIWQNEIYSSSDNPSKNQLYDEPNFDRSIRHNADEKEHKPPPKRQAFEIDKDLYEEVDRDFRYRKGTMINSDRGHKKSAEKEGFATDKGLYEEVDRGFTCHESKVQPSNGAYAKPEIPEGFQRPSSLVQFENDIYETVSTQFETNPEEQRIDEGKQIINDLYSQINKDPSNNPKHNVPINKEKEIGVLYTKPNKRTNSEHTEVHNEDSSTPAKDIQQPELKNSCSFRGEIEIENDLYATPNEIFHKGPCQIDDNHERPEQTREIQLENELYAVPNEVFFEVSNESDNNHNKNGKLSTASKEFQIENELYSEPIINSGKESRHIAEESVQLENDLYSEPIIKPSGISRRPIFSRQNSRTDQEQIDTVETNKHRNLSKSPELNTFKPNLLEKLLHRKPKRGYSTDEENSVELENELYALPNSNSAAQEDTTLMTKRESDSQDVSDDGNVYEDPDQLMLRPQIHKTKEEQKRKKKLQKSDSSSKPPKAKEDKKHDSFIQRLLRQATKKQGDKGDKSIDLATRDESLALLAEIQVLLEKKKKIIKGMVTGSPKSNHRRILSESNAKVTDMDQCGETTLKKSISIDLNDEYASVRDSLDGTDAIYSEVEMVNRHSKELKDLLEELLKRNESSSPVEGTSPLQVER